MAPTHLTTNFLARLKGGMFMLLLSYVGLAIFYILGHDILYHWGVIILINNEPCTLIPDHCNTAPASWGFSNDKMKSEENGKDRWFVMWLPISYFVGYCFYIVGYITFWRNSPFISGETLLFVMIGIIFVFPFLGLVFSISSILCICFLVETSRD